METFDEQCRLCLGDLSELTEYYAIDESLRNVVKTLTDISIDISDKTMSTSMCPKCFSIIESFSHNKDSWTENQFRIRQKTEEFEVTEEAIVSEEIEDVPEDTIVKEDYDINEELGFEVEYVEDLVDLNESDQIEVDPCYEIVDYQKRNKSQKSRQKPNLDDSKEKGKDVYQKLLKKCDECGKMIEKNRLEGHKNKHKNIRPYHCEEENCGKQFYCKLLYRLHKTSIHTGILVTCEVCSKTFPSQRSLYAHSLRHRNENRYNCDFCDRKFNNNNSLKRHMAIHSGIREWKCEQCPAGFYRKFNLDVHVKTVHEKEKSFACKNCPKKFGYSRLLKDHQRKSHGELTLES